MSATTIEIGATDAGPLLIDLPRLIDTRLLITGNSGAGKSRLLRRLAEQAFGEVQVIVIDPEGEFATLRERHDFLLAGRAGEVQAEPKAAALLARRLMELQTSAVIDLYDLRLDARREFVRLFLEPLVDLPKDLYARVLVLLDEAHLFCPEDDKPESAAAVIDLMARGRKRGVCGVLASQRLSKLSKDAAAEAKNYCIGGITLDTDLKRAGDILGLAGAGRLIMRDIPSGQFKAFGPAFSQRGVVTLTAGPHLTTHPKAGQRHTLKATPTPTAIRKIAAELKDLPQQAAEEVRTIEAAQDRIRDLERELRTRPKEPPAPRAKVAPLPKVTPIELPLIPTKRVEVVVEKLHSLAERLTAEAAVLRAQLGEAVLAEREGVAIIQKATETIDKENRLALAGAPPGEPTYRHFAPRPAERSTPVARNKGDDQVSGPQLDILQAVRYYELVGIHTPTRKQVAFVAKVSPTGSGFEKNVGRVRTLGLATFPTAGSIALTDAGRARAPQPRRPTASELQETVYARLSTPQAAMMRVVIAAHPKAIDRETLARETNQSPTGSGFEKNAGKLRTLGLVTFPVAGQLLAQDFLFLREP